MAFSQIFYFSKEKEETVKTGRKQNTISKLIHGSHYINKNEKKTNNTRKTNSQPAP